VSAGDPELEDRDLFENAPCGYLATTPDGTILRVNRTFERWTGLARDDLIGARRFQDLLPAGARIYHETHFAPLLLMQGSVREIAIEVLRADGSRMPALVNAVLQRDPQGEPRLVRTIILDATERRQYEAELVRARRQERDIAQQLQSSMLSGALPHGPQIEVAVAYRPAVQGLDVGGDWYDAFWTAEGTVGLVVGDVVGRGIDAAATMGQLRSAVRALAATGLAPAALLEALDGYVRRHGVGQMATVAYAELTLATGELRYACAGHPPPLIVEPGAEPRFGWDGRSTPLDPFLLTGARRAGAACTLPPEAMVLLYTDGLIERRDVSLAQGLDALRDEVAARRDASVERLVDGVVRARHDPGHADDVCLLAARVGAES
jgi:phosphoserine phosphatase RsbU/P